MRSLHQKIAMGAAGRKLYETVQETALEVLIRGSGRHFAGWRFVEGVSQRHKAKSWKGTVTVEPVWSESRQMMDVDEAKVSLLDSVAAERKDSWDNVVDNLFPFPFACDTAAATVGEQA